MFVEYLTVLPPDATWPTGLLPAEVADWGRGIARRLGEVTRRFHLTSHGGAPYHPNPKGMGRWRS